MFEKLYHYSISFLFILAIAVPAAIWLSSATQEISKQENRKLKEFPSFSANKKGFKKFPKEFEAYFKDHYGFRNELVSASELIKLHLFNKSPSDKAMAAALGE